MFDDAGWAVSEDGLYLKTEPNATLYTDSAGWLYKPVEAGMVSTWEWPAAWDEPTAGNYIDRHPTRYTWREDVEAWARYLVGDFDVWVNTYYDHPEGYDRTYDSFDIWGPEGRGDPVDMELCDYLVDVLYHDPEPPHIEWYIWRRYIYGAWNNWYGEPFGDGSVFTNHEDHAHFTYY
jgi:hypothetical protein